MAGASETLRWIFVDDTDDQAFTFTGDGWTTDNSTFQRFSYSGIPYRGAQHATSRNGSLSVTFSGSSVSLFGTADVLNVAGRPDPTWECFIDGRPVPPLNATGVPMNLGALCGHLALTDGDHTLTVNVTSRGRPFYVDAFQYYPSPQSPTVTQSTADTGSNATTFIANIDPGVQFSQGNWRTQLGFQFANTTGASMSLDFVGSKLLWMGWSWSEFPGRLPSNGTWSIDGGPETPFHIPGFPTGLGGTVLANLTAIPGVLNNQLFFETPSLSAGAHRLDVRYLGPEEAPLTVGYFIVENGDVTVRRPSVPPTSGPVTETPSSAPSTSRLSTGAIAGIAVGSVGVVAIIAVILIIFLRRRRRIKNLESTETGVRPFDAMMASPASSERPNNRISVKTRLTQSSPSTTTTSPVSPFNGKSALRRTMMTSISGTTSSSSAGGSTNLPPSAGASSSARSDRETVVVVNRHEDSGLRDVEVVDLPPLYSER